MLGLHNLNSFGKIPLQISPTSMCANYIFRLNTEISFWEVKPKSYCKVKLKFYWALDLVRTLPIKAISILWKD